MRRVIFATLTVVLLTVCLTVAEIWRCRTNAIAGHVDAATLASVARMEAQWGRPDQRYRSSASWLRNRTVHGVRILPLSRAEGDGVVVSLWERRCFLFAVRKFVVVSDVEGRVLFAEGGDLCWRFRH